MTIRDYGFIAGTRVRASHDINLQVALLIALSLRFRSRHVHANSAAEVVADQADVSR